ncbi:MAG: hypothetical protein NVS9B4_00890 [Candidatus Acidiferrum sp.]
MTNTFKKSPTAVKDFVVDWSLWLPQGETIQTSKWILDPELSLGPTAATKTGTTATVWLAGGTLNQTHRAINRITTNVTATSEDQSIFIFITQE